MIRSEHSIVEYDFHRFTVMPDRLRKVTDAAYVDAADQLLRIYREGIGESRQVLHRRVERLLSQVGQCPPRRMSAFCKLLDDLSQFQSGKGDAFTLRKKVFELGAGLHPIVERREGIFDHELHAARQAVADAVGRPWQEIEADLFSDVIELQRLQSFATDWTASRLLSWYNTSQTQAALFRATRVRIDATDDFKTIVRQAKLAGLMHRIRPVRLQGKHGYRFLFDGPQTSLRETTRYGVRFAAMLPKLLTCRGWQLTAEVLGPQKQRFRLSLSPQDGLRSVLQRDSEFDSDLESEIDAHWHKDAIEGWDWKREAQLLVRGQTVMTPDFVLSHLGRRILVYVEVVGYWTPEYLSKKSEALRQFVLSTTEAAADNTTVKWLLIVPPKCTEQQRQCLVQLPIPTVVFAKKSPPVEWLRALELTSQG